MADTNNNSVARVDETRIIKRRRFSTQAQEQFDKKKQDRKLRKQREQLKRVKFTRIEDIVSSSRAKQRTTFNFQKNMRIIKDQKPQNVGKTAFVIRIAPKTVTTQEVERLLQGFNLTQKHIGAFVKLTEDNVRLLKLVENHVTYGSPSRGAIQELLFKRGALWNPGTETRSVLTSNTEIEKRLGAHNCVCIEDLVAELHEPNNNEHFDAIIRELAPFKLPKKQYDHQKLFKKGGDAGDRGNKIDDLMYRLC